MLDMAGIADPESVFAAMKIYDEAAVQAEALFGAPEDCKSLDTQFKSLYGDAESGREQKLIGCAFNHTLAGLLFSQREDGQAEKLLDTIARHDTPIRYLNMFLGHLDTTFTEQCVWKRQFLSPSELDQTIFEQFAPGYEEEAPLYAARKYLFISAPHEDHIDCTVAMTKSVESTVVALIQNGVVNDTDELARQEMKMSEKAPDTSILRATHPGFNRYLALRFSIHKAGELPEELIDYDSFSHSVQETGG